MTFSANLLMLAALAYAALLFGVAFLSDWRAKQGRAAWLDSALVYTLSISVYCTSWTFFGAVGSATRSGLEFATIYLGPTLVFVGWALFMQKLVRVGRAQRTTSIADMISSRYGKSPSLAALATIIAVIAVVPYIALQLKAIATTFNMLIAPSVEAAAAIGSADEPPQVVYRGAFWVAAGLAAFTIVFGTRNLDANARHHGVVAAIALEALVKLAALIALAIFAISQAPGGLVAAYERAPAALRDTEDLFGPRWVALTFLAGAAIICLPRQFQVTVVECVSERHGRVASSLFPAYLLLIGLCVLPIAIVGHAILPAGWNEDFYVLLLPMQQNANWMALLVFLGGFSSATSMVVVSCIALSTMVSNHLIMPLALGATTGPRRDVDASGPDDVRSFLLSARRLSVCAILLMGFLYFRLSSGETALASIGLISFAGVAQFLPALVAALFWRRATARGAAAGLLGGILAWAYTLFLPTLDAGAPTGLFGLEVLRPDALFGLTGLGALEHGIFWSLLFNIALLIGVSLSRPPSPMEQIQGAAFVEPDRRRGPGDTPALRRTVAAGDLHLIAQRILGDQAAHELFDHHRRRQGVAAGWPLADHELLLEVERRVAGSVGAASARAMINRVTTGESVSLESLMRIADENAQLLDFSQRLQAQAAEIAETAEKLREANALLRDLDEQKDEFLSQISHELRTPMTALQSFAEILLEDQTLDEDRRRRFVGIIHRESLRLTRILDQILDLDLLERQAVDLNLGAVDPAEAINRSLAALGVPAGGDRARIWLDNQAPTARVLADADRLQQVMMNLIANALKYSDKPMPGIWIELELRDDRLAIIVSDDGPGVPDAEAGRIFSKFQRATGAPESGAGGVGLGLAICREIMRLHNGSVRLAPPRRGGATFEVTLPLAQEGATA